VSGGSFGDWLPSYDTSTLTIFGTGFNFAYGDYLAGSALDDQTLTCTLADGTPINNYLRIDSSGTITLAAPAVAVSEPSSLAMFGIGAPGLFSYGRRRRKKSAA